MKHNIGIKIDTQTNGTDQKATEINPQIYTRPIFGTGKKIYIGKRETSLINDARKLRCAHAYTRLKQTQLSVHKTQLKLVKELNAESENEKL